MAKQKIEQQADDTWTATCGLDTCGPFVTERHLTRKSAKARIDEHMAEHEQLEADPVDAADSE